MAAALITSAQVHPRSFMRRELTRFPITFRSLVSKTTITTNGGASKPFRIADQKSILTALSLAKSSASPTRIEATITA